MVVDFTKSQILIFQFKFRLLIILRIQIASGAPVGTWNTQILTSLKTDLSQQKVYEYETPFYVLFNPFSKGIVTLLF